MNGLSPDPAKAWMTMARMRAQASSIQPVGKDLLARPGWLTEDDVFL